ncbi:MAG: 50S ribosomal protein L19e [Candidatus Undinarchaeales archaeon]
MKLKTQKRLASKILKTGENRIWIDPDAVDEVSTAMTRGDIRKYIGLGFIDVRPKKGNSRGRTRKRNIQRKKGRQKGHGKRSGGKKARTSKKRSWIKKIRAQRRFLKKLRDEEKISNELYRKAYRLSKAGTFKNKAQLRTFLLNKSKKSGEK